MMLKLRYKLPIVSLKTFRSVSEHFPLEYLTKFQLYLQFETLTYVYLQKSEYQFESISHCCELFINDLSTRFYFSYNTKRSNQIFIVFASHVHCYQHRQFSRKFSFNKLLTRSEVFAVSFKTVSAPKCYFQSYQSYFNSLENPFK